MLLLLAFLSVVYLPSPWGLVGALSACALGVLEVLFWHPRVHGLRVGTGAENLVGATGAAVGRLDPSGYIRVLGELWEARAATEMPQGTPVRVTAVDGLVLDVETARTDVRPAATAARGAAGATTS